ncbi:hypothetical protein G6F56_006251 [Rhizopus delemar]|nr:hypothetical protein G6F56_006251 [Rhizopus delemar]
MATSVEQKSLNEAKPTHTAQDIGLIFIREYYTFLNKTPSHLHAFYNKDSLFVRGDEGTISETARGQEEIAKRIDECHFEDCKVLVTQVDSQLSANNGILVHVLGEMCNHSGSSQKFSQTFFLATQQNGYYVLNDIFRFLKDEVKIDYYSCEEEPFVQPEIVAKKEEDVTVVPPTSPIPTKIVKQQVEEQSNKPKTWANLTAVTAAATGSSTGTTSPELSAPVTPDIVSPVIQEAEKPVQLEIQEPEPANQKAVKSTT